MKPEDIRLIFTLLWINDLNSVFLVFTVPGGEHVIVSYSVTKLLTN